MFGILDAIIILFLLMGALVGFKRGVIKSATMFIGAIIVIFLSYSLKNPVSKVLYSIFPFFNFAGDFEGLTVLNIVIYEAIAFVLVYIVLMSILQVIIKITGGIETILKFTIVLGIPSKLLGALFGLLETFLFVFVALFLLQQIPTTNSFVKESLLGNKIVNNSPILSNISEEYYKAFEEILSIKDQNYQNKEEYNRKSLEILLKYNIVKKDAVEELIEKGKLKIPNSDEILKKYN